MLAALCQQRLLLLSQCDSHLPWPWGCPSSPVATGQHVATSLCHAGGQLTCCIPKPGSKLLCHQGGETEAGGG